MYETESDARPENAILIGVIGVTDAPDESLDELAMLTTTAGAAVVERIVQRRDAINASTFIGSGKVQELKDAVTRTEATLVVANDELSPAQMRNLEKHTGVRIIDRSVLILDIFARHARTHEAKLQVELAQLQYLLPRLTRMWEHLGRTGGGIGTRGPGETQLEVDRRRVRTRVSRLQERIKRIKTERAVQRKQRSGAFRIALVGYTNAGKSTLFNALTRADVLVADKLFATLDTTTRQVYLGPGVNALLSDTVGFIRKLPHHLVASFRSTLEEVVEADLLLHVVDASHPEREAQIAAVEETLRSLVSPGTEVRLFLNKLDRLDESDRTALRARHPGAWRGSAVDVEDMTTFRALLAAYWMSRNGSGTPAPQPTEPTGEPRPSA